MVFGEKIGATEKDPGEKAEKTRESP